MTPDSSPKVEWKYKATTPYLDTFHAVNLSALVGEDFLDKFV